MINEQYKKKENNQTHTEKTHITDYKLQNVTFMEHTLQIIINT